MHYKGFVTLALLAAAIAAPIQHNDQTVLSPSMTVEDDQFFFNGDEHSMRVNMTFDRIDLTRTPRQDLKSLGFIDFDRFEVLNTTAAIEKGWLNSNDSDAAASKPNALHNIPQKFPAPSVFRSNVDALATFNISQYFDLISFSTKPLASNASFAIMEVWVWEIDFDKKEARDYDVLGILFPNANGTYAPLDLVPRDLFAGWGEKINYVEFSAYSAEKGNAPLEFAVDNVVLQFHGDDERGYEK